MVDPFVGRRGVNCCLVMGILSLPFFLLFFILTTNSALEMPLANFIFLFLFNNTLGTTDGC